MNTNKLYQALANRAPAGQVHIQDFVRLGDGNFKFVAAIANIETEDQLGVEIASMTEGAARLIPGSTEVEGRIVVGVVAANKRSRPLDGSFKMVTACTAADASGNIWSVINDGSGKRVVLESADDLESILDERRRGRAVVASPAEGRGISVASWDNGDVVRYFDADRSEMACAMVFDVDGGIVAVDVAKGGHRSIATDAILSIAPRGQLPAGVRQLQREVAGTALTGEELEKALAFLLKSGNISEEMAEKYRQLSKTPARR